MPWKLRWPRAAGAAVLAAGRVREVLASGRIGQGAWDVALEATLWMWRPCAFRRRASSVITCSTVPDAAGLA